MSAPCNWCRRTAAVSFTRWGSSAVPAREIPLAAALGCDTFLTGETSHADFYNAQNAGLNVIYGGHYTTETVGVQALGEHLQERFGVAFEFIDLPTGM